jgi:hypothetical protein
MALTTVWGAQPAYDGAGRITAASAAPSSRKVDMPTQDIVGAEARARIPAALSE